MANYHCTKCGNLYNSFKIKKEKVNTGANKGKKTPVCCGKELRKISKDIHNQIVKAKK